MNTDHLIHFLTQASRFSSRMQAERNQLVTAHTVKEAAVLVGIVLHEGAWQILLTKRAETLRQHTGQIAFAGGRKDTQDDSLTATALREAYEETAIPIAAWQTFAPLPFYDTPSGYRVTPVPAICVQPVNPKANPGEVAEIFLSAFGFRLKPEKLHIPPTSSRQSNPRPPRPAFPTLRHLGTDSNHPIWTSRTLSAILLSF